jgi:CubicO group peptidase (beta-lactamase class C family)
MNAARSLFTALSLTTTLFTVTAVAQPSATTQHRDAVRLVEHWLEATAAYDRLPALSAGIVIGQDLVWSRGYGTIDERGRVPATAGTIYGVCSISKLFTAIAAMHLWEAGRLPLDDDVARLIPDLRRLAGADPDSGPVTVRSLLTHSSGVPREIAAPHWTAPAFASPPREQLLADLARQRSFMRVGDHYSYSNLGFVLVGEAVASASGRPFEDYVRENVLVPLQLKDTTTRLPVDLLGTRLAVGYGVMGRDGTRPRVPPYEFGSIAAAAGFASSVDDFARFAAWQFRLHRQGGQDVLRVATLREMHRVHWTDPDGKTAWGLGFAVSREGANTVVSHSGVCPGYETAIALALKDEVGVIALTNANAAGPYTRQMRQLLLKGIRLPVNTPGGDTPDLDAYTGLYGGNPHYRDRLIVPWGKDLALLMLPSSDPAGQMALLRRSGLDTFRHVRDDGTLAEEYIFQRDASARVTGYKRWNYSYTRFDLTPPARLTAISGQ